MASGPAPQHADENNQRTVQAYEGYARRYTEVVSPEPSGVGGEALIRFAEALGAGARVLEIGSGPGWDADHLETRGLKVRRTDVTAEFRTIQAERGHEVGALDILTDQLGGPWDGVLMLYVLQHIARADTGPVLGKVAAALCPDGLFLVSFREGDSEIWEGSSGDYWVVERPWAAVEADLGAAGLSPIWSQSTTDTDGAWRIVIARRTA